MSKLKNITNKSLSAWVDFPDIEGFKVHLHFLKREELLKIRNSSLIFTFNKRTRQKEEEVDNAKFIAKYAEKVILDWQGLYMKNLPDLMPIDLSDKNGDEEIPYDLEDAIELLNNSTIFDQFVSESLNDYELFSNKKEALEEKN
jgi:hypothetical protein